MKEEQDQYRDLILSILLMGIIYWFNRWEELLILVFGFILLGLASKYIRIGNQWIWMSITRLLQYTIQPLIGTLVFFLILTPIGLLSQVFKKKKDLKSSSFISVEREFDTDFFKKQW